MKLGLPTQIFVLRCWQVHREDGPQWRFRLEIPSTEEAHIFTSLEALMRFLEERLDTLSSSSAS